MVIQRCSSLAADVLAWACEKCSLTRKIIRNLEFDRKERILKRIRRDRLPANRIADCRGVRFELDLRDDVQFYVYFNAYELTDLQRMLRLIHPGATCIDIGANIGFYTLHMARHVGAQGRVHAFEPDPRNFARLQTNCALNPFGQSVECLPAAAGDREGAITFHQSDDLHCGWSSVVSFADIPQKAIQVPVTTLDDFIESRGMARADMLKIDVEAYEFEVLAGAKRSLSRQFFQHVLIEFNGQRLWERGRTLDELIELFRASGYRPDAESARWIEQTTSGKVDPKKVSVNLLFSASSPSEFSSKKT